MGMYDFYERRVFPQLMDRAMRPVERYRAGALAPARGRVLEIGFGTGLNLPHYSAEVEHLSTVDPMDAAPDKVRSRIAAAPFPVERHRLPADGALPFDDHRFDAVTMTWSLCTIPDPLSALAEVRRVARPGAPLLFIEHGRSSDPRVARWQDRLNPVQRVLACGCNLNRRIDELIVSAGFRLDELDRFDAPRIARILGHLYRGVARAAR